MIVAWFHASRYDTPIVLCYLSVVPSLAVFLVNMLAAPPGSAWAYHRLEQTLDDLENLTFAAQSLAREAAGAESSHSVSR